MPVVFKILFFVFLGVALMVWIAQKKPVNLTPEQQRKMSKWIMILMSLSLFAWLIKYMTGH